jgi:protein-S-isoprenylcysteine O-methyltransferase Ste14
VVISILLLFPFWLIYINIDDYYIFNPPLYGKLFLFIIFFCGIVFGYLTSREYDNKTFLGINQIKRYFSDGIQYHTDDFLLKTDGILGLVRHPYYFSGLLIIWGRPLKLKDLIVNIIFTVYFIVGALNEERKLIVQFVDSYREYRKHVPMLIPNFKKIFWKKL